MPTAAELAAARAQCGWRGLLVSPQRKPGRPLLYGTTTHFLEFFSMKSLRDLPTLREFTELSDESRRVAEAELGDVLPDMVTAPGPPEPPDPAVGGESVPYGEESEPFDPVPTEESPEPAAEEPWLENPLTEDPPIEEQPAADDEL